MRPADVKLPLGFHAVHVVRTYGRLLRRLFSSPRLTRRASWTTKIGRFTINGRSDVQGEGYDGWWTGVDMRAHLPRSLNRSADLRHRGSMAYLKFDSAVQVKKARLARVIEVLPGIADFVLTL